MNEDIKRIANHFGTRNQLEKAVEECGELAEAIHDYLNGIDLEADPVDSARDREHVIEEMADVLILIEELAYLLSARPELWKMRGYKIERTLKRMKDGYYAETL